MKPSFNPNSLEHHRTALNELTTKHAALLVENADLKERIAWLEQTLALIRAQQDYIERNME